MTLYRRLAAVALVGALAACGGDDPSADESGTTTAATSSTALPAPTAAEASTTTTAPATTAAAPSTTPAVTSAAPTTADPGEAALFDFALASSADGWQVINDTVMGGVSNGELTWADGALVFRGELSLANNGGFASIRSPEISIEAAAGWAARPGVRVEAEGDGRTWTLQVRMEGDSDGWIATLTTKAEGSTSVEIPWNEFEPVTRFLDPRNAAEPLDPSRIATVAFFLVDGIEGQFRLGLRAIG